MAEQIISPGVFTSENDQSFLPQGIGQIGAAIVGPTVKGPAFVPTTVTSFAEYERKFGPLSSNTFVPQAVREYLKNAGSVTVCRVLAGGGYTFTNSTNEFFALIAEEGSERVLVGVVFPSKNADLPDLKDSTISELAATSNFSLTLSGTGATTTQLSASINPANSNYIFKQLGDSANNSKDGAVSYTGTPGYGYLNFKNLQKSIMETGALTGYGAIGSGSLIKINSQSALVEFKGNGLGQSEGYSYASTPMITSQFLDAQNTTKDLFKFHTIAHGTSTNNNYKVSIANLREPSDIDNEEQYSTFTVLVRKYGDKDKSLSVLETFNNVNLDPDSTNYIARVIGDKHSLYNDTLGKVETLGDFPNTSDYIRVEVADTVASKATSPKLSPKGFAAITNPISTASLAVTCAFPSASLEGNQEAGGNYNSKAFLGWKFDDKELDNSNFIRPLPESSEGNVSGKFNVENYSGHASSSLFTGSLSASLDNTGATGPTAGQLKFTIPFQGGEDGIAPWKPIFVGNESTLASAYTDGNNVFGFDLNSTNDAGYKGYKKALDILSNQDEYDINMLALPGVIKELHSPVTNAAIDMVEDRGDTFYVMDLAQVDRSVNAAINAADGLDTNYAAVYYPWVKVLDASRNKPVFVPPSVIVPGAIAASDKIAAEWFAPAGLNRGVLGNVIEAKLKLNQAERDRLYTAKINPIATFPRTGVAIWGQKTLQERSTALDRINVRRLLIKLKKYIASSSRYLVFEQNTQATRNRFLNLVNPYLESVQQRQGLYSFKVVMDDTNNTPDVVDRNQLVGQIFLQPTKTAEFIVLDFNVLPTGATFE